MNVVQLGHVNLSADYNVKKKHQGPKLERNVHKNIDINIAVNITITININVNSINNINTSQSPFFWCKVQYFHLVTTIYRQVQPGDRTSSGSTKRHSFPAMALIASQCWEPQMNCLVCFVLVKINACMYIYIYCIYIHIQ